MISSFYKKIFKNLDSDKIFYINGKDLRSYKDLKVFYQKFVNVVSFLSKKRNKIFILSEKSFELYAASVSVVLSNNIWTPVSQTLPEDRIIDMINILSPDLFIFDSFNTLKKLKLKNFLRKRKINVISFEEIVSSLPVKDNSIPKYKKIDTSMIFFTSGSTGKPKGVKISHSSYIFSLIKQVKKIYSKNENLIFGDYHDISFVISLNILFPCIYLGAKISPGILAKDILFPIDHINRNKVNTIVTVPTTINRIKHYYKKIKNKLNLKFLVLCGEPFYFEMLKYLISKNFSKNIFNAYGSTELSPWGFCHKCSQSDLKKYSDEVMVPIGKPFEKVKIKILEREIYIGGPLLSNGYVDPRENEGTFKTINNTKFYKTGDIAVKKKDVYFIKGRNDSVVKVFGYRVDLFDIDAILRKNNKINNCFVFTKENFEKEKIICAAIEGKKINERAIVEKLKKSLPNYMIPKELKVLGKFPVNKNNKLDRIALKKLFV